MAFKMKGFSAFAKANPKKTIKEINEDPNVKKQTYFKPFGIGNPVNLTQKWKKFKEKFKK